MIEFTCPNCSRSLKARSEDALKSATCKSCGQKIQIPEVKTDMMQKSKNTQLANRKKPLVGRASSASEIAKLMDRGIQSVVGLEALTEEVAEAWYKWGLKMFALGQHHNGYIDEVKYDGHLIILDDGSRWEVDDLDTSVASLWGVGDRVVVLESEMYKLDDFEKVQVTED